MLYTRAVNDLTPGGRGLRLRRLLLSRATCSRAPRPPAGRVPGEQRERDVLHAGARPERRGNGHVRTQGVRARDHTVGTIAHEFQHLINASRRLYVNHADSRIEKVWLDEALAHVAEELNFYAASGLAPRQNLGQTEVLANQARVNAFNEFQLENFGRSDEYLRAPASTHRTPTTTTWPRAARDGRSCATPRTAAAGASRRTGSRW